MYARKLPEIVKEPTIVHMANLVGTSPQKPSLEEVLEYAGKQADKIMNEKASHLPREQKEEVRQNALVRAWKAYECLDIDKGWMSFIQRHAKGALLDYLREGKGFKETQWDDIEKEESKKVDPEIENERAEIDDDKQSDEDAPETIEAPTCGLPIPQPRKIKQRLNQRMSTVNQEDDRSLDVGEVAGIYGVHIDFDESISAQVNWDLVARMASVDPQIHLIAKLIRGFTETSLAPDFGVTREMLSQRLYAFGLWLDDEYGNNPWARQALYAFGLEEAYGVPIPKRGDQKLGWGHDPVNLDSSDSLSLMSLFKQFEFGIDLGQVSERSRIRLVPKEETKPQAHDNSHQVQFGFLES